MEGEGKLDIFVSHKPMRSYPSQFPYDGLAFVPDRPPIVVGRSMVETTALPPVWAERANQLVDWLWIPSQFLRSVLINSGVAPQRPALVDRGADSTVRTSFYTFLLSYSYLIFYSIHIHN
jgi:hypothetical protein